ncbi:Activity-regulated cytoskeleton associated protein 2 [Eumeta japonica]|uniref:Activity-regulated cytoskeleton associated protein 2 n=1 Tax=Eumeta variegata TaxID=151549 RepID=A0A4C1WJB1_EUMVA|nr:Activity-regulated cytoskeleton associated protein 2 [Eumeta japonica]
MYSCDKERSQNYQQLFSLEQGDENTDIFVARARALLVKLPLGAITEKVEIDIVYGLLHKRIRKRLPRDAVISFDDLVRCARDVEDSIE